MTAAEWKGWKFGCIGCFAAAEQHGEGAACDEHVEEARLAYLWKHDRRRAMAEDADFADYAFENGGDR